MKFSQVLQSGMVLRDFICFIISIFVPFTLGISDYTCTEGVRVAGRKSSMLDDPV